MKALAAESVCGGYEPGHDIVHDVSLDADMGFTALVGPNGAGKTTLLRLLAGLLSVSHGEVRLEGRPVRSFTTRERAQLLAMVTQHAPGDSEFTALQTVLMGRTPWKRAFERDTQEDIDIALRAMEKTHTAGFRDRYITELSGGERQRVLIARALCQQPRILLLDEPVSALDIRHQVSVLDSVREAVTEQGLTCVCVLHDLNLASHYADQIIILKNGYLAAAGAPEEVLERRLLETVYETEVRILRDEEELRVLPAMRRGTDPDAHRVSQDPNFLQRFCQ